MRPEKWQGSVEVGTTVIILWRERSLAAVFSLVCGLGWRQPSLIVVFELTSPPAGFKDNPHLPAELDQWLASPDVINTDENTQLTFGIRKRFSLMHQTESCVHGRLHCHLRFIQRFPKLEGL